MYSRRIRSRSRRTRRRLFVAAVFLVMLIAAGKFLLPEEAHDSGKQQRLEPSDNSMNAAASIEPLTPPEPEWKVVIDPGHGGMDPGAEGASGRAEKDFSLQLSLQVKELLEQESNIEVNMTRSDDEFISSVEYERAEFANALGADLFVSIHGNTYSDPDVSGTETYYYDEESLPLATVLHRHVVEAAGFRDRGVKQESYFVLRETTMPAALIEVGYLTNPQDEQRMWEEDFQRQVAASIAEGIKEYIETYKTL